MRLKSAPLRHRHSPHDNPTPKTRIINLNDHPKPHGNKLYHRQNLKTNDEGRKIINPGSFKWVCSKRLFSANKNKDLQAPCPARIE